MPIIQIEQIFLSENHILEQRAIKDYNYFCDNPSYDIQKSNISSPSHSKSSSRATIDTTRAINKKLVQNPINRKFIADPVYQIKNVVDNYFHGRSSQNPITTLNKINQKLQKILIKINENPQIIKVKHSSKFIKMVRNHNRKINKLKKTLELQKVNKQSNK